MKDLPTARIGPYQVFAGDVAACVTSVVEWIERGGTCRWLACLNPHSYVVAAQKPEFAAALLDATWLVPDGIGIVLASQLQGGTLRGRVTGPDVFTGVHSELCRRGGGRVFFMGSSEDTLEAIRRKMAREYPGVEVVGVCSPPFKASYSADEMDRMVALVNAARPDVLWVGMTAPKQELWIYRLRSRLDVKFVAAVGAMFDFYAGTVQRPSPVFRKLGLEWAPRLLREPRRLWRRTFVSAPLFVWHMVRNWARGEA